eukprot:m.118976 g.118976  ORF g.118976 m.118976 type:complete len:219 (-) comp28714_c1_seq1:93-749(-)
MGKSSAAKSKTLSPTVEAEKVRSTLKSLFQQVRDQVEIYEKISGSCIEICGQISKVTERIEVVSKATADQDAWAPFKGLPDLPGRLAITLQRAFESLMKDFRETLDSQKRVSNAIAQLCEKGNRSFDRNHTKLGLVESARRTATSPSIVEFIDYLNAVSRLYLDQWEQNKLLLDSITSDNADGVATIAGKWDALILGHSSDVVQIFRVATFTCEPTAT